LKLFADLSGLSLRTVSSWASHQKIGIPTLRRVQEIERLLDALATIMESEHIPVWLQTPNELAGNQSPLELLRSGQADRVWRVVFFLESGQPT